MATGIGATFVRSAGTLTVHTAWGDERFVNVREERIEALLREQFGQTLIIVTMED